MQKPPPKRPSHGFHENPGHGPAHDGANHAEKRTTNLHNSGPRETEEKADHLHSQHPQWHTPQKERDGNDARRKKTGLGAWIKAEIKGAAKFSLKITVRITISISVTISVIGVAANNKPVEVVWNKVKQSDYIPPVIVEMVDNVHGWTQPIFLGGNGPGPPPGTNSPYNMGPIIYYTDRFGGDYSDFPSDSPEICQQICSADDKCVAFSFALDMRHCWLKDVLTPLSKRAALASGVKIRRTPQQGKSGPLSLFIGTWENHMHVGARDHVSTMTVHQDGTFYAISRFTDSDNSSFEVSGSVTFRAGGFISFNADHSKVNDAGVVRVIGFHSCLTKFAFQGANVFTLDGSEVQQGPVCGSRSTYRRIG